MDEERKEKKDFWGKEVLQKPFKRNKIPNQKQNKQKEKKRLRKERLNQEKNLTLYT